jgi:hypothetical protein
MKTLAKGKRGKIMGKDSYIATGKTPLDFDPRPDKVHSLRKP